MAEKFRTYTKNVPTKNSVDKEEIIIGTDTTSDRTNGYVAQIHSIYISQYNIENNENSRIRGTERYNPANFSAFDLYVKNSDNTISYIVYDGRIVPGAPFFIEKNITLEPKQSLCISCPRYAFEYDIDNPTTNTQLNQESNVYLSIVASAVLFPTV